MFVQEFVSRKYYLKAIGGFVVEADRRRQLVEI